MPAIYTPPEIERRLGETDDGDHGGGRRPPTDKLTGGNGEPDNWNPRKRGPKTPRERLERLRVGLFLVLLAVLMFFAAIISVFFVAHSGDHYNANDRHINAWLPMAIPSILWLNSAILFLSSVTIEIGRRHMFREMHVMDEWLGLGKPTSRRAMPWVAATVVLGTLFLVGQLMAWNQLAAQRITFANPSSHSFFLMTGVHAFHLVVGVLALVGALVGLIVSRQMESRQIYVDLAAWYWHSMGVLWLLLFFLMVYFK
jgi:cytochrome c oxidase subunit 3